MKLHYCTNVWVGYENGPGVNEAGFLRNIKRMADVTSIACYNGRDDLVSFPIAYPGTGKRTVLDWLASEWRLYRLMIATRRPESVSYIFRLGAIPLAIFAFAKQTRLTYGVKTCGRGIVNFRRGTAVGGLNRILIRGILKRAKFIDTVSVGQQDLIVGTFPETAGRVHVIDNGIDLDSFINQSCEPPLLAKVRELKPGVVIGYVGNRAPVRGGAEVVQIAQTLRRRGIRAVGLIAGESGPCDASPEIVVRLGKIPFSQVYKVMRTIDCGVSILRSDELDCTPQKVRQYAASGCFILSNSEEDRFIEDLKIGCILPTIEATKLASYIEENLSRIRNRTTGRKLLDAQQYVSLDTKNRQRLELLA